MSLEEPSSGADGAAFVKPSSSSDRLSEVAAQPSSSVLAYDEYLPASLSAPAPLIVWLHDDLAGADVATLRSYGLLGLIAQDQWADEAPFIVVSPRREDRQCLSAHDVASSLSAALNRYDVDPARVYLIGAGCGASAAWELLATDIALPITASLLIGGDPARAIARAACTLTQRPIWALRSEAGGGGGTAALRPLEECEAPAGVDVWLDSSSLAQSALLDAALRGRDTSARDVTDPYTWLLSKRSSATRPAHGFSGPLLPSRALRIDLGAQERETALAGWNNLSQCTRAGETRALSDDQDSATFASLRVQRPFSAIHQNSRLDASLDEPFPHSAMVDSCMTEEKTASAAPSVRINHLDPRRDYRVTLYASLEENNQRGTLCEYIVNGRTARLDAKLNVSNVATIGPLTPDADGALHISV